MFTFFQPLGVFIFHVNAFFRAALLKMKGKYIVNEKRLLQLFSCKCPSCGCKLKTEKVTLGLFIILNQQCLQCEYRNQWKSQVNTSIPTAEEQHLRGCTEVISETQKAAPTDDTHISITCVPEDVAVADEESESEVSSDQGDMDSDEDWKPAKHLFPTGVLQKAPGEETEDEDEEEDYDSPPPLPKHSQLCAECGLFFNRRWPHTCKHKIKPYPCNICGKRCVSEVALNTHSRIHDENYKHQCKYCQVTFKTKVDKVTHEQIHMTEGKPYKCPDCSETFATNKERKIHLEDHRGPKQLNCHICGMEFLWPLSLQRHLAVHTGVKPYKCSVCQRGFNQASHLKSHMRLHTGERPYKCQHCDKRFNHNVSLKSHVQRYHTSSSGHEQKEEETKESSTGDFQDNGIKRGAEPRLDNVDEEHDTEDEVLEERIYRAKKKRRSTGRPIGRPKSYASGNTVLAIEVEGQGAHTEAHQLQVEKLRRRQCSDEGSEDELTDSDVNFDSAEEEEERSQEAIKITERSGGKGKNSDSDSDFDPENSKEKRQRGPSLGKRRGRPRKHEVV
uniref:C2H2-type domain-containing protein n=1 Tax=Monopterus albus TaxID=43700 RepID=A0A3Q3R202_MONAL